MIKERRNDLRTRVRSHYDLSLTVEFEIETVNIVKASQALHKPGVSIMTLLAYCGESSQVQLIFSNKGDKRHDIYERVCKRRLPLKLCEVLYECGLIAESRLKVSFV